MATGVRLVRSIGSQRKAAWVSAAFWLPVAVLAWLLWTTSTANIEFSAKERRGVSGVRPVITLLAASAAFLAAVRSPLLGEAVGGDAAAYLLLGNRAVDPHYAENRTLRYALDGLLVARVDRLQATWWLQAGVSLAGLALASCLLVAFYRVTPGGIAEVAGPLTELSRGKLTLHPRPWGCDEMAQPTNTLRDTLASLRSNAQRLARERAYFSLRPAVPGDSAPAAGRQNRQGQAA